MNGFSIFLCGLCENLRVLCVYLIRSAGRLVATLRLGAFALKTDFLANDSSWSWRQPCAQFNTRSQKHKARTARTAKKAEKTYRCGKIIAGKIMGLQPGRSASIP